MKGALRISEAASIGLHTMVFLAANQDRFYSSREISDRLRVSEAHQSKILQRLAREGLLRSVRGPKGGFKLGKPKEDITLLDIYEVIEGRFELRDCLMEKRTCRGRECIMGDLVEMVNRGFREYLGKKSLVELEDIYGSNGK